MCDTAIGNLEPGPLNLKKLLGKLFVMLMHLIAFEVFAYYLYVFFSLKVLSALQFLLSRVRTLQETVSKFPLAGKGFISRRVDCFPSLPFLAVLSSFYFELSKCWGLQTNWSLFILLFPLGKSWSSNAGLPCSMKFKPNLRLMLGR